MVPLQLILASALAWSGEPKAEILDFTAVWCGPCQQISPVVSKLQRDGLPIRKVDVDQERDLANQYGIKTIPTFVLVIDGKEVSRSSFKRATPEAELRRLCALLPSPAAEPKAAPRQAPPRQSLPQVPVVVANNNKTAEVDLGAEGAAPKAAVKKETPKPVAEEKPGMMDRLLGRKKKEVPAIPAAARAQEPRGEEVAADAQPVTPLAATVRLRIKDARGDTFGTGTIIDSRPGCTWILTCGHIFRQWKKGNQVQVDLFRGDRVTTIVGTNVAYDLDDDVGLVSISTDSPLPAIRVAGPDTKILKGTPVVSSGCSGGDDPTLQAQRVTSLNRYQGADNIECSAVPEQGRSGGGLFTRDHQLIGVCWAANPNQHEGLYAGLRTVHKLLDRQQLSRIYRTVSDEPEPQLAEVPGNEPDAFNAEPGDSAVATRRGAAAKRALKAAEPSDEPAADDAPQPIVSREDVVDSEVVIIIHSRGKPGTPSKVVRLHRASHGFWQNLMPELDPQDSILETALKTSPRSEGKRTARREARRPTTLEPEDEPETRLTKDPGSRKTAREPEPFRRRRTPADQVSAMPDRE